MPPLLLGPQILSDRPHSPSIRGPPCSSSILFFHVFKMSPMCSCRSSFIRVTRVEKIDRRRGVRSGDWTGLAFCLADSSLCQLFDGASARMTESTAIDKYLPPCSFPEMSRQVISQTYLRVYYLASSPLSIRSCTVER